MTFKPPQPVVGQLALRFRSVVQGSAVTISETTTPAVIFDNPSVPYNAWHADVTAPLGGPIQTGDDIEATQTLCNVSSGTVRQSPAHCTAANLVPKIASPHAGDDFVLVTYEVPGSNVRVFDHTSTELGNGSSSVVGLSRTLVAGEIVYVVAQLPTCSMDYAYSIVVTGGIG